MISRKHHISKTSHSEKVWDLASCRSKSKSQLRRLRLWLQINFSLPRFPHLGNNEEYVNLTELLRELTKIPQETASVWYSPIPIITVIIFRAGTMSCKKTSNRVAPYKWLLHERTPIFTSSTSHMLVGSPRASSSNSQPLLMNPEVPCQQDKLPFPTCFISPGGL